MDGNLSLDPFLLVEGGGKKLLVWQDARQAPSASMLF
jgi:hypothetical protein